MNVSVRHQCFGRGARLFGLVVVAVSGLAISALAQSPSKPGARQPTSQRPQTRQAAPANNPRSAIGKAPTPAPSPTAEKNASAGNPASKATTKPATGVGAAGVGAAGAKAVASTTADGKFILQHKLNPGETLRTRTVHVANTVTRIQGAEDFSESRTTSDKVWQVQSINPEGQMTFEYRIEAVDMSQKQSDKPEITYNSRTDKTAPEMFARVADTIAKPIAVVTIDRSGTVIERDNQSKAPPLGMGELAIPLPKEPVAIGATWEIPRDCRVKLENGIQKVIKLREQYTLDKVSAGVATISVKTTPITPVDEPGVEAQLMQQMSHGVIKFDIDRGRLISKQLDWDDEVVGFRGAETSLKYYARFTEEPIDDPVQSAKAPATGLK